MINKRSTSQGFTHRQHVYPNTTQAMEEGKNVRLIYQGRVLADDASLASCGVESGAFLHCAVTNRLALPVAQPVGGEAGSDGEQLIEGPEWLQEAAREGSPEWQAAYAHDNGASQPRGSREGTWAEFMLGVFLGVGLRWFATIWLWQRNVSRRTKLGILAGMVLRMVMDSQGADTSSNQQKPPPQTGGGGKT